MAHIEEKVMRNDMVKPQLFKVSITTSTTNIYL